MEPEHDTEYQIMNEYEYYSLYDDDQYGLLENEYNIPTAICGVFMALVAIIGITGNILTAYIFSRRTMGRASIGVLLTGLAVIDAALLIVAAPLFASSAIFVYKPSLRLMTVVAYLTCYVYPIANAFQTASVWLMTVTAMERYMAVCKPFLARTWCTRTRAWRIVGIVLLMAVLYNVCRFWEYTPAKLDSNSNVIAALPAQLRENHLYMLVYVHWMYFVFIFGLPFLVLSLVNGLVISTIRRARLNRRQLTRQQRKEHATATMMMVVTCAYLTCTSLAFVINGMELWGASGGKDVELPYLHSQISIDQYEVTNYTDSDSAVTPSTNFDTATVQKTAKRHSNMFYFLIDLNNLLVMIHCSANFFIYYNFSQRFRAHVRGLILKGFRMKHKNSDGLLTDGTPEFYNYNSCLLEINCRPKFTRLQNSVIYRNYESDSRKLSLLDATVRKGSKVNYRNSIQFGHQYSLRIINSTKGMANEMVMMTEI